LSSTTQTPDFIHRGSVRVDLLGGTIDIYPINHILENVVTLNAALSLQAEVEIKESKGKYVTIISEDYGTELKLEYKGNWEKNKLENPQFKFVIEIIESFNIPHPITMTLRSGAPTGSGLGGSSSMGVTILQAMSLYFKQEIPRDKIIRTVQNLESRQLNKGVPGYQDYHPALYGGVLALIPEYDRVRVDQLYTDKLGSFLEGHCSLYYSNHSRFSGINNWEVFKQFFDDDGKTRTGLQQIADLSQSAHETIKSLNYSQLIDLMVEEGQVRAALFDKIITNEIRAFIQECDDLLRGYKMCGAGGGGCFLVFHHPDKEAEVEDIGKKHGMAKLDFRILPPLNSEGSLQ
jgi:D-glycero-alpha-D-manno-heptose-7-phosphate kinase